MNQETKEQRVKEQRVSVEVGRSDLPLHCPMPGSSLWDSHPRVFLPIEEAGDAKCPYCGTEYKLIEA